MKICRNCGEINSNDCDFCVSCGKREFVFQEEIVCSHCGATNDKSFVFCIYCGNKLMVPYVDNTTPVVNPAPATYQDNGDGNYSPVPVVDVYGGVTVANSEEALCPNCRAPIPVHAIFCQRCGASVAGLHDHRIVRRKICPHCGRPNSLESQFCSYCFASLATAETEEMQVVHDSKPVGTTMVKQAYLEDDHGKKKICTGCGALNPMDELFCVSCGLKLDSEDQVRYCPNCGAENSSLDSFCIRCQWSFDGTSPDTEEKWVCNNCKTPNDGNNKFCVSCGAKRSDKGRKK